MAGRQLTEILGRNLAAFREAEACPQSEFAERLEVEPSHLDALERGAVESDLATVEALATRIGMKPLLLLQETCRADEYPPVTR